MPRNLDFLSFTMLRWAFLGVQLDGLRGTDVEWPLVHQNSFWRLGHLDLSS